MGSEITERDTLVTERQAGNLGGQRDSFTPPLQQLASRTALENLNPDYFVFNMSISKASQHSERNEAVVLSLTELHPTICCVSEQQQTKKHICRHNMNRSCVKVVEQVQQVRRLRN